MKIIRSYIKTFEGLSPEVWWLSLITFVNRFGAMVIPFLSIYLNERLDFSIDQVSWVTAAYGLGSVTGSYLGGKLTDQLGYYKVILMSLVLTGINFLWVMHVQEFWMICLSFFILITLADMGRPAFFCSLKRLLKTRKQNQVTHLITISH